MFTLVFFINICPLNTSEPYPLSAQWSLFHSNLHFVAILTLLCAIPSKIIISSESTSTAQCILELFPVMLLANHAKGSLFLYGQKYPLQNFALWS